MYTAGERKVVHRRFYSIAALLLASLFFSTGNRSDAAGVASGVTFDTIISDGEEYSLLSYGGHSRTLVQGGEISFLRFLQNSYGEITGGNQSSVELRNNASALISGGDQSFVNLRDEASALITDGTRSHTNLYDRTYAEVSGGEFSFLTVNAAARADVVGGNFGGLTAQNFGKITVGLGDASIGILRSQDGGVVDLYGGVVRSINPLQYGRINIYGGTVQNRISLNALTVTNVYVKTYQLDFNRDRSGTPIYDLTGVLGDGSPINVEVSLPTGAELNFIVVPEPTHFGILALATFCSPWLLRRKHPTKKVSDRNR